VSLPSVKLHHHSAFTASLLLPSTLHHAPATSTEPSPAALSPTQHLVRMASSPTVIKVMEEL
jgi:hypothetical protein